MAYLPPTDEQIKQAQATHGVLVARQSMDNELSSLYRKNTLSPAEMNRKVALQSASRNYQEPSDADMKNHAMVVSTAAGRNALGIKGRWPMSQTPHNSDGSDDSM